MRSSFLIPCLVLILMNIDFGFSRMKTNRKSSVTRKSGSNIPKTNVALKPGQLLYRGTRLALHLNVTDESQFYSENYAMFPDGLYYPRPSTVNDFEEFLGPCINTTLQLETNKDKLTKLNLDIYGNVTLRIIEYLCTENYNRDNDAGLCPKGLWVVTTVIAMLSVMNTLA
ncbi:hypothetical protein GDO81_009297 [Engystomops pustulosus]|uniref:Prion/Doppel protein beta-ribbon domain-containing protein n=1 Tax=Engystomops pustulosus TaxID=76066 RepID=A0AAV7BQJ0_ENGPU|nr:hypothetical protein GDO81_009297 [Engystomops pustulosus]